MNPKDQNFVAVNDVSSVGQNLSKKGKVVDSQQHKKQVRRRLHTSKPYQERLLNMAEARREIVTALKFHRASMKEASEQQKKQQQQEAQEQIQRQSLSLSLSPQPSQYQNFEKDGRYKSRRNPRIYPSCKTNSSNYLNKFSYPYFSRTTSVPNSYTWSAFSPISPIAPPPLLAENPNFILPNQTLGLNLNFHDFNNLEITVHLNNNSSLSSSYSSGTSSSTSSQEVPSVGTSQVEGFMVDTIDSNAAGGLHTVMDDEAMAEIRTLGDQHQMEWNDTMNLVKSACWFKYLKHMEHGGPDVKCENDAYRDFDQPLEFPAWLNANESCLEKCLEDCFHDSTLPCMDIEDMDGIDDDWLA